MYTVFRTSAFLLAAVVTATAGMPVAIAQDGQLRNLINSRNKYFNGARQARGRGYESIGRGARHMRHGRHSHNPPEVRTGALEVANGILGLLAAAAADRMGNKDDGNAGNLDQITGTEGAVPGAAPAAASAAEGMVSGDSTGSSLASTSVASKDDGAKASSAEILKDPEARAALKEIEAEYGYSPREFLEKLEDGRNPEQLFAKAPENPMTRAEAREAQKAATEGASGLTAEGAPGSPVAATGSVAAAAAPAGQDRNSIRDELARRLANAGGSRDDDDDELELSPDVKAALARKEAEEREQAARDARNSGEINLFEVVHRKYLEREKNLRFGEPLRTADLH